MHDTLAERLIQEMQRLRADIAVHRQLEMLRSEIAALRLLLGQPEELNKLSQQVESITSTVDAGSQKLADAVEENKPE